MTAIKRIKDQPGGVWAEGQERLVPSKFSHARGAVYIQPYLEEVMQRISKDLEERGFPVGQNDLFRIVSGYRTQAEQDVLWQKALDKYGSEDVARDYVAKVSAHQTGAVIDVDLGFPIKSEYIDQARASDAYAAWEDLAYHKYKMAPYDVEPWHWECGDACRENIEAVIQGEEQASRDFDWNKKDAESANSSKTKPAPAPAPKKKDGGGAIVLGTILLVGAGAGALLWMRKKGLLTRRKKKNRA